MSPLISFALVCLLAVRVACTDSGSDAPIFLSMILKTLSNSSGNKAQESPIWNEASRKWREHGLVDVSFAQPDSASPTRNKKRDGPSWAVKECSDNVGKRRHPRLSEHVAALVPLADRKAVIIEMSRCSICDALVAYNKGQLPKGGCVFIFIGNDNWGLLSDTIPHRTAHEGTRHAPNKGGFIEALHECGKSLHHYKDMLDDPGILLVVANQHIHPSAVHPKVLSIPIGVKSGFEQSVWKAMHSCAQVSKKRLLLINNSGKVFRKEINTIVIDAFKHHGSSLENLYGMHNQEVSFYEQFAESKFVLCPPGIGHDTYRHWEVILMGSIPIFETNPGFDRAFKGLPVLIVQSFSDVTPELLEVVYSNYTQRARELFDFRSLAVDFWEGLIRSVATTGRMINLDDSLGPWDPLLLSI